MNDWNWQSGLDNFILSHFVLHLLLIESPRVQEGWGNMKRAHCTFTTSHCGTPQRSDSESITASHAKASLVQRASLLRAEEPLQTINCACVRASEASRPASMEQRVDDGSCVWEAERYMTFKFRASAQKSTDTRWVSPHCGRVVLVIVTYSGVSDCDACFPLSVSHQWISPALKKKKYIWTRLQSQKSHKYTQILDLPCRLYFPYFSPSWRLGIWIMSLVLSQPKTDWEGKWSADSGCQGVSGREAAWQTDPHSL